MGDNVKAISVSINIIFATASTLGLVQLQSVHSSCQSVRSIDISVTCLRATQSFWDNLMQKILVGIVNIDVQGDPSTYWLNIIPRLTEHTTVARSVQETFLYADDHTQEATETSASHSTHASAILFSPASSIEVTLQPKTTIEDEDNYWSFLGALKVDSVSNMQVQVRNKTASLAVLQEPVGQLEWSFGWTWCPGPRSGQFHCPPHETGWPCTKSAG